MTNLLTLVPNFTDGLAVKLTVGENCLLTIVSKLAETIIDLLTTKVSKLAVTIIGLLTKVSKLTVENPGQLTPVSKLLPNKKRLTEKG